MSRNEMRTKAMEALDLQEYIFFLKKNDDRKNKKEVKFVNVTDSEVSTSM